MRSRPGDTGDMVGGGGGRGCRAMTELQTKGSAERSASHCQITKQKHLVTAVITEMLNFSRTKINLSYENVPPPPHTHKNMHIKNYKNSILFCFLLFFILLCSLTWHKHKPMMTFLAMLRRTVVYWKYRNDIWKKISCGFSLQCLIFFSSLSVPESTPSVEMCLEDCTFLCNQVLLQNVFVIHSVQMLGFVCFM